MIAFINKNIPISNATTGIMKACFGKSFSGAILDNTDKFA